MNDELKKKGAATILGVIIAGLMGNAWSMYNDVQMLKVREPLNREDLIELKAELKEFKGEVKELRQLLIETRYAR